MARSTRLAMDQEYIYFMGSDTLPSACYIPSAIRIISIIVFFANIVYPFTLRVTGEYTLLLYE